MVPPGVRLLGDFRFRRLHFGGLMGVRIEENQTPQKRGRKGTARNLFQAYLPGQPLI